MAGEPLSALGWRLRRLPVCASTEIELDRWLRCREGQNLAWARLAVVARRQRYGHGQQGRVWQSPAGGLWLSAALPWADSLKGSASLGLAVAVGLALQLEALGLAVQLKWPNDLLIEGRKLAGLLPRLRLRGERIRWAQVGVGLNGSNRVPPGAIALAEALGAVHPHAHTHRHPRSHPQASPQRLLPRVLAALDWASAHAQQPEAVRLAAEARLWRPADGWLHGGEAWQVLGLHADGRLRLNRDGQELLLERRF